MHQHNFTPGLLYSQSCFDCWNLKIKMWEPNSAVVKNPINNSLNICFKWFECEFVWLGGMGGMSGWNCSQQTFDLTIWKLKNFVKCSNNISNNVEFDQKNLINVFLRRTQSCDQVENLCAAWKQKLGSPNFESTLKGSWYQKVWEPLLYAFLSLFKWQSVHLYNKCVVAEFGAAAASILLQNLEPQGFFREVERDRGWEG